MKLIKPSYTIMFQEPGMAGLLKHIELCGRTAYKSEAEIKDDSAIKFVAMLIKRGHGAVLEHGTVYLRLPDDGSWRSEKYLENQYSEYNCQNGSYFITTNYRVIVENGWTSDLVYQCEPTEFHEKRSSIKFVCDRGVSHEFVRHRVFSFCQESTRYCNYSATKFGNELTFIIPSWLPTNTNDETIISSEHSWFDSLNVAEDSYLSLLVAGWTPQQARSVLPNSLKTELIMTGTIEQWKGFFKLRCAPDAHPQARELAIPLQESFKELGYV